jgi:ABC-2 type transport system permease protein
MSELALAPAAFRDTRTMVTRCLRLSSRNVEGLITAVALPIMLMLMFVYLFGGALSTGMRYVDYVVPGVLLVCMGFGAASTAVSVSQDLASGVIDRFRSMDVSGASLVAGHVVASVARNIFSTVLVFGVAFAVGFRTDATLGQWLAVAGILVLFVLALSWLAATIGIAVHSPEAANGLTFLISFLPYLSSAFVPVHTMPSWLQGFSDDQPVAPVIDSVRALLTGGTLGSAAWHAVVWSVAIIAVSVPVSGVLFRRRAR